MIVPVPCSSVAPLLALSVLSNWCPVVRVVVVVDGAVAGFSSPSAAARIDASAGTSIRVDGGTAALLNNNSIAELPAPEHHYDADDIGHDIGVDQLIVTESDIRRTIQSARDYILNEVEPELISNATACQNKHKECAYRAARYRTTASVNFGGGSFIS